jgi:hypothetical protein
MDININIENNNECISISNIKFQKMAFLFNAINDGWTIKKKQNVYIFIKNHEGKKEVFDESYLLSFMKSNFNLDDLLKTKI